MKEKRTAVYAGTRNLYDDMIPAMKSLLVNSNVEEIVLLTEDGDFPIEIPECVRVINVSRQKYFHKNGPNYNNPWSYMVLIRAAIPKLLPEQNFALSLDVDTIVDRDISKLWTIPMDNHYIAGVPETKKSNNNYLYINFGVAFMNLKKMRDDEIVDGAILRLNKRYYFANEQDCINQVCQGGILRLPSTYNSCNYTAPCIDPRIIHFAGIGEFPWSEQKRWQDHPIVEKYRKMSWEEVMREHEKLLNVSLSH